MITITYSDGDEITTTSFRDNELLGLKHFGYGGGRNYYEVLFGTQRSARCTEDTYFYLLKLLKEKK